MRVMICGGSNYRLMPGDYRRLDTLRTELGITALLSGGTPGAELGAEVWAATRNVTIRRFEGGPDHERRSAAMNHGLAAAPAADAVVAFPGAPNLQAMLDWAKASGLRVYDWRKEAEEEAAANDLATRVLDQWFGFGRAPAAAVRPRR